MPDGAGTEEVGRYNSNEADPLKGSPEWLAAELRAIRRRIEEVRRELADLRSDLPEEAKGLLTYSDVAERLNCSVRHVQTLAHSGELTPIRLGRAVRFDPEAIEAFVKRRAEESV